MTDDEPMTIAAVFTAVSTVVGTVGALAGGAAAQESANFKARQLAMRANEERAAGTRAAAADRRKTDLVQSRLQALAAASGGGADDPTIVKLGSDIEGEGELAALTEFYKGENKARGYMDQASASIYEGKAARTGSYFKAAGTFLDGAGSLFSKYAPKTGSRRDAYA